MSTDDQEAIRELLHRYCHYADAADTEGWLSLYVKESCSLDMGMGAEPMVGVEALRQFASARRPGTSIHLSSNAVISVEGDEAGVASYVVVIRGNDNPKMALAGRYDDRLRKVDGEWRFVARKLEPQMRATS
jgi:ketosteroid isomerase-like protein